jgi:hypothetical protein
VYRFMVAAEKKPALRRLGTRCSRLATKRAGEPFTPAEYVERYAPGRSWVDVGGTWGINGEYSFLSERAGASQVVLVDIDRIDEFDHKHAAAGSKARFVKTGATDPALVDQIRTFDMVRCTGLLYHVPDRSGSSRTSPGYARRR